MAWRDMTAEEAATLPEARLGGALLWMVVAAALLCIVAIVGSIFAFHQLRAIGARYMIAVGLVSVWSVAFIVLTLLRAPVTPMAASVGLVAWIAYRFSVSLFGQAGWPMASISWARPFWPPGSAAILPPGCDPMPIIAGAFPRPERP
jgi:hypothetical protein